ncbi:MAG: hypothetical protein AB7J13_15440 [Pyrinomonadaceae bacterium]
MFKTATRVLIVLILRALLDIVPHTSDTDPFLPTIGGEQIC